MKHSLESDAREIAQLRRHNKRARTRLLLSVKPSLFSNARTAKSAARADGTLSRRERAQRAPTGATDIQPLTSLLSFACQTVRAKWLVLYAAWNRRGASRDRGDSGTRSAPVRSQLDPAFAITRGSARRLPRCARCFSTRAEKTRPASYSHSCVIDVMRGVGDRSR